jgi:hypothetical protein
LGSSTGQYIVVHNFLRDWSFLLDSSSSDTTNPKGSSRTFADSAVESFEHRFYRVVTP